MKTKIWTLLIAVLLCISCKKDSIFTGSDAHIVSFSLTADGVKYPAAITESEIIITVPSNVNLNGAKAEYSLCENASILPLPEDIQNWNEEQLFRIQAFQSSVYSQYKYTVRYDDVIEQDNVVLSTQSQVNEFAAKGINKIEGNLIIGSSSKDAKDPVTDLSRLSSLEEVELNVVINNGYAGSDLTGLHRLKKIGGLYIGMETTKASTVKKLTIDLTALTKSTNIIIHNDNIKSILLPSLETTSNIYINSLYMEEIDMSSLKTVEGPMTIKGNVGGSSMEESNNSLVVLDLSSLQEVYGAFTLENLWALKKVELPALKRIDGALDIQYVRYAKTISLPLITSVGGAVNILSNDGMVTLSMPLLKKAASMQVASFNSYSINLTDIDMNSLEEVDGGFTIKYYAGQKLEFPALKTIGGTLSLNTIMFMEEFSTPSLTTCGAVDIQSCPYLEEFDMSGIEKTASIKLSASTVNFIFPETVTGAVTISGLVRDTIYTSPQIGGTLTISATNTILCLSGTKKVGEFSHTSGTALVEFSMPDLEESKAMTISSMEKVVKYSMPSLKTVTGNLSIKGLLIATGLDFSSLTTVTSTFTFYGGRSSSYASKSIITNLDAFSTLTTAKKIDIRYGGSLVDFTGMKNVLSSLSSSSAWKVSGCAYNPSYNDMLNGKYTNN